MLLSDVIINKYGPWCKIAALGQSKEYAFFCVITDKVFIGGDVDLCMPAALGTFKR